MAKKDNKIVAITAAMPKGTGLDRFAKAYPDRFFDVGIAEGHAVGLAAGLAKAGLKPVIAIYSTFLQRSFDQIMFEVCLQNLGVVFVIDRAGVVGEDGVTHQGIFDIAYLRTIPGITIMAPCNAKELEDMLEFAVDFNGPVAIRYPRGSFAMSSYRGAALKLGKAELLKKGKDIAIVALGSMVSEANDAAGILAKEDISVEVVNARFASPLDKNLLNDLAKRFRKIVTIEEGVLDGGLGSAVSEALDGKIYVKKMGLPLEFIKHDRRDNILAGYGLNSQGIVREVRKLLLKK